MMVMTAVTSQAPISNAGEPTPRLISAGTRKIPEPIIDPTTIAVALKRPRLATKPGFPAIGFGVEGFFPLEEAEVGDGELTCPTVLLEKSGQCQQLFISRAAYWSPGMGFAQSGAHQLPHETLDFPCMSLFACSRTPAGWDHIPGIISPVFRFMPF